MQEGLNISWVDYIALNNPGGTRKVLAKYGYPFAQPGELPDAARMLVSEVGAEAVEELMDAHPDTEMILERQKRIRGGFSKFNGEEPGAGRSEDQIRPGITLDNILQELKALTSGKNQQLINTILLVGVGYLIIKSLSK